MNLLLLSREEVIHETIRISGRRAEHCLRVLGAAPGRILKAGVMREGTCSATVVDVQSDSLDVELSAILTVDAPRLDVVLAVPRPKAVSRILAAVASFGVRRLHFINTWKVEKAYFDSPRLAPARILEDCVLGAEQGAQVWVPEVTISRRFGEFQTEVDPTFHQMNPTKIVLDPSAPHGLGDRSFRPLADRFVILAFGPEGGFIDRELQSFAELGYQALQLGTGPLKTEVAVAAALGQLALARTLTSSTD